MPPSAEQWARWKDMSSETQKLAVNVLTGIQIKLYQLQFEEDHQIEKHDPDRPGSLFKWRMGYLLQHLFAKRTQEKGLWMAARNMRQLVRSALHHAREAGVVVDPRQIAWCLFADDGDVCVQQTQLPDMTAA